MATTYGTRVWALDGMRQQVNDIQLIGTDGTTVHNTQGVAVSDFDISFQGGNNPELYLNNNKTLTVGDGTTIGYIRLVLFDETITGQNELAYIDYQIGGASGEEFPDGGEIEVTSFEVQLNDI